MCMVDGGQTYCYAWRGPGRGREQGENETRWQLSEVALVRSEIVARTDEKGERV